jgi:cytochrome c-type protein NapC
MLLRKVRATFELWGHLTGVIDTKEKFEAHRYELAKRVWVRMKETDSLECRNCHHENAWNLDTQSERAKNRHAKGKAEGKTCIDCHFGIAHKEPEGGPGPQELKTGN